MVRTGADRLARDEGGRLRGLRVGLIANATSRASDGTKTLEVLQSCGARVVRLFAPEHGLSGTQDAHIRTGKEQGLDVVSLYRPGARNPYAPSRASLRELDALVFDVQDIGARFYTYSATLGYAMEACERAGLAFVVLDRPNPIGGRRVDGPVAQRKHLGFTAFHPMPVRHGMTLGELARLYRQERGWRVPLTVVRCAGWTRDQRFDATGLPWIDPSPAIHTLEQALLYPGVALTEFTNISVGRGTHTPFQLVGAPWADASRLARAIVVPGVEVEPADFTPQWREFAGQACHGVRLAVRDPEFDTLRLGCELVHALAGFSEWDGRKLVKLVHHDGVAQAMIQGGWRAAAPLWQEDVAHFMRRRGSALLYS